MKVLAAKGSILLTDDGEKYDCSSRTNIAGHCHPKIREAIQKQLQIHIGPHQSVVEEKFAQDLIEKLNRFFTSEEKLKVIFTKSHAIANESTLLATKRSHDEYERGFGRCGYDFFIYSDPRIKPSVIVLGECYDFPLGIIIAPQSHPALWEAIEAHQPLNCAANKAVFDLVKQEGLSDRSMLLGEKLRESLDFKKEKIFGSGLDISLHFDDVQSCKNFIAQSFLAGALVGQNKPGTVASTISPPLTTSEEEIEKISSLINSVLKKIQIHS